MANGCNVWNAQAVIDKRAKRLANRAKKEEALKEEEDFIYVKVRKTDFPGVASTPPAVVKPLSDKQLATRMRFGMAMQFLSQVKTFIEMSHVNPKKSPQAAMTSHLLKNCFVGEYPDISIDYSKVMLGRQASVTPPQMGFVALKGCKLFAHWSFVPRGWDSPDDQVYVILYNIDQKKFLLSDPVPRGSECGLLEFDEAKPKERFVVYSFVKSGQKNCNNRYVGEGVFL